MAEENQKPVEEVKQEEVLKCEACGKELKREEAYVVEEEEKEIYYCDECLAKIKIALEEETKNLNIPLAIIASVAAGIIGGLVWYWITVLTDHQMGYLAIALGWLVGMATSLGAGRKKGAKLQVISVVTTLITLLLAEFMIALHYIGTDPNYQMSSMALLRHLLGQGYSVISLFIFCIKNIISPMGLIIWGIGLYTAFMMTKARKI